MTVQITYFVHGTTTDNERGLATGWLPGELSELGRQQTQRLRQQITDKQFDTIFCSDLQRAIDSAEILFGDSHEIIHDSRLRECNYGDMTGQSANQFKNDMEATISTPFPNGESYRDVEARMAEFLGYLRKNYQNKRVAIVAHQGPQLALDVLLANKTWQDAIQQDWRRTKSWQPGWEYIL